MREVYLDWAAAAPVSKNAKRVFMEVMEEFGNPSSPHAAGVRAHQILENARTQIARLASVKPDGVIFASGATEANNLAIRGHVQALVASGRKLNDIHVLYLPSAHASVVESIASLVRDGLQAEPLILTDGEIDLIALQKQVKPETALVCVDVVCGETGTRFGVRDVRRILDKVRAESKSHESGSTGVRIILHADASQAPLTDSFELQQLGADLLTLDAQKVGGMRGIGALLRANSLIPLAPILHGGGQEFGLRAGTENPALAAAFAEALKECVEGREEFFARAAGAREQLLATITDALNSTDSHLHINVGKDHTPHILNISFSDCDTDYAVMLLSQAGYAVSTKSACETNEEGSRAVFALTNDQSLARSTLRVSWGPTTHSKDLQKFAQELIRTIRFIRDHTIH